MEFETWKPGSPDYAQVDAELRMRLTMLFFFCNRPTLGALMGLGGDLSAAFKDPAPQPDAALSRSMSKASQQSGSEGSPRPHESAEAGESSADDASGESSAIQ